MNPLYRTFALPVIVTILVLFGVFIWGGVSLFLLAALLTILEVTLSFDNAVVNARVLGRMNAKWQQRFLTWGILIAVVLTRFILPILIVAASVALSPIVVAKLAFTNPESYGHLIEGAHYAISSFGGAFLLMVSLKYFFDQRKDLHWIRSLERQLAKFGRIDAIEIGMTLLILALIAFFIPAHASSILFAGIVGVILFIIMHGITSAFSLEEGATETASSALLFVYLNVLDAAFSLDGVVGAFAITNQLVAIVAGLGIGAYFVRTFTVYMVRQKTLDTLVYLEHGAHYAILGLAISMLASLFFHIPEAITGLIGLLFVGAAYWSSVAERKQKALAQ